MKSTTTSKNIHWQDNPAASKGFICMKVKTEAVIENWRQSAFSYEWLNPDGSIKAPSALTPAEQQKRLQVEQLLKEGKPLNKPVLGIGIMDNVEIGSGREILLTLADQGHASLDVHVPKNNADLFEPFAIS